MRYVAYIVVALGLQAQFMAAMQQFRQRIRPRQPQTGIRSWFPSLTTHDFSSIIAALTEDVLKSDLQNFLKNYVKNNKFRFGTPVNSEDHNLYFLRALDVFEADPVLKRVYRDNKYAREFLEQLRTDLHERGVVVLEEFVPDIQTYIPVISDTGFWGSPTRLDKKIPLSQSFIDAKIIAYANYLESQRQLFIVDQQQAVANMNSSQIQKFLKEKAVAALERHGYLKWALTQFGKTAITPSEWKVLEEYLRTQNR
jgi:hypothetical protein